MTPVALTAGKKTAVKVKEMYCCTLSLISALDPTNGKVHMIWEDGQQDRTEYRVPTGIGYRDRPARSESLHRLSHPGQKPAVVME